MSRLTLLQLEFLDSGLVWSDGRTLDADAVFLDRLCSINRHLIICLISIRQPQVVVFQIDVKVGMNEFVLDVLPYDSSHLVSIELYQRVLDLDLWLGSGLASRLLRADA